MSKLLEDVKAKVDQNMRGHFEHFHRHPEIAFEEVETAKYIAGKLKEWGYEVHEKLGKTGVVGVLKKGTGNLSIALRADTDALPMEELADVPYKSEIKGKGHMCGHDGHTTMLLGGAEYIAKHVDFNGTLVVIFQPAEEIMGGAYAMIEDGLYDKVKFDYAFGMHNMPTLPQGKIYLTEGPVMSAVDNWEIKLTGIGSHGSMPEHSIDPVVGGATLVMALQTIVSRNVAAKDSSVITVGAFQAGDAGNIIPQEAILRLSMRNTRPDTRVKLVDRIKTLTKSISEGYGLKYAINEGIPGAVTVNDDKETKKCREIVEKHLGIDFVGDPGPTFMASEDFAFYAQKVPGVYAFIGNGDTAMVHDPSYKFNQDNLAVGAAYWASVVKEYLK